MGGARGAGPGLGDGRQELLLLAQGVGDEEGQGTEARGQVLQLGLQAADLLLQVFAPIVELCDQVVHDVLHLYGETGTRGATGHRRGACDAKVRCSQSTPRARSTPAHRVWPTQERTWRRRGWGGGSNTRQEARVTGKQTGESWRVLMSLLTRPRGSEAAREGTVLGCGRRGDLPSLNPGCLIKQE